MIDGACRGTPQPICCIWNDEKLSVKMSQRSPFGDRISVFSNYFVFQPFNPRCSNELNVLHQFNITWVFIYVHWTLFKHISYILLYIWARKHEMFNKLMFLIKKYKITPKKTYRGLVTNIKLTNGIIHTILEFLFRFHYKVIERNNQKPKNVK